MSSHAAPAENWRSRLTRQREAVLLRVAFAAAGAAVTAGLVGVVALASW